MHIYLKCVLSIIYNLTDINDKSILNVEKVFVRKIPNEIEISIKWEEAHAYAYDLTVL